MMEEDRIQPGSKKAPESCRITITAGGPYLVFGHPPLKQQFLLPIEGKTIWYYKAGRTFSMADEPTALCRCGASKNKPYCDGSHAEASWDPALTAAPDERLLDGAKHYDGPKIRFTDNEKYCALARFCDAGGQIWGLVTRDSDEAKELVIREANHCPAGRLSAWNKETGEPYEPELPVALGLIEDPVVHRSGPLWIPGGIPFSREVGATYEIRNPVTLCRCGCSSNKPFCDGSHVPAHFEDGLGGEPDGEEF